MQDTSRLKSVDDIARNNKADVFFGIVAPTGIDRKSFHMELKRIAGELQYDVEFIRFLMPIVTPATIAAVTLALMAVPMRPATLDENFPTLNNFWGRPLNINYKLCNLNF